MNRRKQGPIELKQDARARFAVAWGRTKENYKYLTELARKFKEPVGAKLKIMALQYRAQALRIKTAVRDTNPGPLSVPNIVDSDNIGDDLVFELRHCTTMAMSLIRRYDKLAIDLRSAGLVKSAWVCDTNKKEVQAICRELKRLIGELNVKK
jgi:hypothetical protein